MGDLLDDDYSDPAASALVVGGCRSKLPASMRKPKCAAAAAIGLICENAGESIEVDQYASEVSRLLNDEDWEVRLAGCDSLALMGERGKEQAAKLATLFDDEKFAVRARAAYACGKLKDPDVASGIADLIGDSSPSVREEAMLALAELGDEGSEYIEKVFEKMTDFSPTVRAASVAALGKMGEKGQLYAGAIAHMLLDYEAPVVTIAAIEALGNMEDHGAAYAEAIQPYLHEELPQTRQAASEALTKLGKGSMAAIAN